MISYYDLKAYAVKNNPEWRKEMSNRKSARLIAHFLKSMKRNIGLKYTDTAADAIERYIQAECDALSVSE